MSKIIKENGNIWDVTEYLSYGVKHISKILIGTYDEKEEVKEETKEEVKEETKEKVKKETKGKKTNKKEVEN